MDAEKVFLGDDVHAEIIGDITLSLASKYDPGNDEHQISLIPEVWDKLVEMVAIAKAKGGA